jgi:hypothetical protein
VAQQGADERVVDISDRSDELLRLAERLIPERNRAEIFDRMDAIFAAGVAPDPPPSGFQRGRLLGTSTWAPWDGVVTRIARSWMPWLGKTFSPSTGTGLNRFTPTTGTRIWLRALFPRHNPDVLLPDRLEAFPFRTCIAPGKLDPGVRVMKIDYDFEANPALIRHILDELVQIAPDRYLGKVLFRSGARYRRIGFFSLGI